jgi:DNA-binding MarR family transcriptional regulator
MDRLDDAASRLSGLNRTDMHPRNRQPIGVIAPTDLARLMDFTVGGMATVIERLEKRYVSRRPAGTDRRRLIVEVTETESEKG